MPNETYAALLRRAADTLGQSDGSLSRIAMAERMQALAALLERVTPEVVEAMRCAEAWPGTSDGLYAAQEIVRALAAGPDAEEPVRISAEGSHSPSKNRTPRLDGAALAEARRLAWLNHGCEFAALYGDDGEMSCGSCLADFKRCDVGAIATTLARRLATALPKIAELATLREQLDTLGERHRQLHALQSETARQLALRDAEIARLRRPPLQPAPAEDDWTGIPCEDRPE